MNTYLVNYWADYFQIWYVGSRMEGIKCVNFIEINPVVIETWVVENGELAVPVNNTLVFHKAFLAADTQPCGLMNIWNWKN